MFVYAIETWNRVYDDHHNCSKKVFDRFIEAETSF